MFQLVYLCSTRKANQLVISTKQLVNLIDQLVELLCQLAHLFATRNLQLATCNSQLATCNWCNDDDDGKILSQVKWEVDRDSR